MIVPEGKKLNLDPKDEYTHEPEAASNYNESMYYHAFDRTQNVGGWVRIGNRVNEGHAEVTACLYLPDGRVGFMYGKPKIEHNREMNAGGMKFEVIEPFKHIKVTYDGDLLLMTDPYQMANPGVAFKSNPRVKCQLSWDFHGVSPMHGGEIVNQDGSPIEVDPATSVFRGHTEQHVSCKGSLTVDGTVYPMDGFGFRDKSWGPRFWNNFFWYKWLPVTFGPDFGVMVSVMGRPGDTPFINGHVFANGKLNKIVDVKIDTEWDENYYPLAMTAYIKTAEKDYTLTGKSLSIVPLRHRRTLPSGEETNSRITEGMTLFQCDGRSAVGMVEYLDLMDNGKPISVTDPQRAA